MANAVDSYREQATFYRAALLLGLVPGTEDVRWAETVSSQAPVPPPGILDLVLTHPDDRTALRAAGEDADSSEAAGWLALYDGRLDAARALLKGTQGTGSDLTLALGILSRTRGDAAPELGAAFLALARGDSSRAAVQLVAAAARHPDAASAILAAAARLLATAGTGDGAVALWQRIVTQYPESPEAAESELEWARTLRGRGDVAGAIAHLEHLILSAPASALLPQARRELELARGAGSPP